jgi:predicted DNA-binding protein with PD1-like motif
MNYQVGTAGRMIVARFDHGEDILTGLENLARRENLRAASFQLVGALAGGRFVVGPECDQLPPSPVWRELGESHEVVGFGTIFWEGDRPRVHFHGAFGKGDSVRAGCLREASRVFLVVEAVITEIDGITASRAMDPASGMVLLTLAGEGAG